MKQIGPYLFQFRAKLAEPKTCWWSNVKPRKGTNRWRYDTLFGITRAYERNSGLYIYKFIVGRLNIGVCVSKAQ